MRIDLMGWKYEAQGLAEQLKEARELLAFIAAEGCRASTEEACGECGSCLADTDDYEAAIMGAVLRTGADVASLRGHLDDALERITDMRANILEMDIAASQQVEQIDDTSNELLESLLFPPDEPVLEYLRDRPGKAFTQQEICASTSVSSGVSGIQRLVNSGLLAVTKGKPHRYKLTAPQAQYLEHLAGEADEDLDLPEAEVFVMTPDCPGETHYSTLATWGDAEVSA